MVLTRQEKEKLIIDLYNQGKNYKQIAGIARVSVRDIKPILEKAEKEREEQLGMTTQEGKGNGRNNPQPQKLSVACQAYHLFSEGKTPLQIAVELNLRETEATKYYREHWKLKQLYNLNLIYEDIGDDILPIIRLHRRIKDTGINVEKAINIIKVANYDLPVIEQKYQTIKKEVNTLEFRKTKDYRTLQNLEGQISVANRMLKSLSMSCQEEAAKIDRLQWERIKLRRLVKRFKDDDEEYSKILKTVEQEVSHLLLDGKELLRLAFYSLMELIRKDPHKYSSLIYYKSASSSSNVIPYIGSNTYGQQQQYPSYDAFFDALKTMLLNEAEKLYKKLLKEWTNGIVSNYSSRMIYSPLTK